MESLFDPDRPYFSAWVKLFNVDKTNWISGLESKMRPEAAPLYYAALCGFHEIVEHLALKHPEYANAISGGAGTALHSASYAGHVEVVRSLLKCGVDVDARGVINTSPLNLASHEGRLDVVQCLLGHGADANSQNDNYRTPLSIAAAMGHLEIVRTLLEHSADIYTQDIDGSTPLHRAMLSHNYDVKSNNHPQVVRVLLEHGANPNARDNKRRTPLHLISSSYLESSFRLEIARILLAHGADVDAEDEKGRTPLQLALAEKKGELVHLLSEYCSK